MADRADRPTGRATRLGFTLCVLALGGCAGGGGMHADADRIGVGEALAAIGAMIGAGAALCALQEAGGDPDSGTGYLFQPEHDWYRGGD